MRISLLFLGSFLVLVSPAAAQRVGGGMDKVHSWYASTSGDLLGRAVAGLGDLDGDGVTDVAAGAPGYDLGSVPNAGFVRVWSGANGALLHEFFGSADFDNVGSAIVDTGDLDQDGVSDFAFSATGIGEGVVYVHSGASGALLSTHPAPGGAQGYGESLANLGDVNGDGAPELAIGASGSDFNGLTNNGSIFVVSLATGNLVRQHDGVVDFAYQGMSVAAPGDVDGDGIGDLLGGALWTNPNGLSRAGSAYVWSGATGALIHTWDGDKNDLRFGEAVGAAGDVDGDGVPDLAAGAPADFQGNGLWQGSVSVFSGATGNRLWQFFGGEDLESVGSAIDTLGDFDGDGSDDLMVGAPGRAWGGRVYLLSGADGSLLYRFESEGFSHDFGDAVDGIGDTDGDGELEAMIGASRAWNFGPTPGAAYLYSFSPFLDASTNVISASAGGTVTYTMDFGPETLNMPMYYGLLASSSGTGPSTIQGWKVPLTQDALYASTFAGNYPSQIVGAAGQLDANGDASAVLTFAPGEASALVGRTFFLAAVKYGDAPWTTPTVQGVSVVEPLTYVP